MSTEPDPAAGVSALAVLTADRIVSTSMQSGVALDLLMMCFQVILNGALLDGSEQYAELATRHKGRA